MKFEACGTAGCIAGWLFTTEEREAIDAFTEKEQRMSIYPDQFGQVVWTNEDIRQALRDNGKEDSDANVAAVRDSYEVRHITEPMIEAGWQNIRNAIHAYFEREE